MHSENFCQPLLRFHLTSIATLWSILTMSILFDFASMFSLTRGSVFDFRMLSRQLS